jgi:hypothetical protein
MSFSLMTRASRFRMYCPCISYFPVYFVFAITDYIIIIIIIIIKEFN